MNKRGLSAIVATLLIILLAIIAFAIVSVVIRNTVGNTAEKIELNEKCLEVEIHATQITKVTPIGEDIFDINFTRSISGETIEGIKVILENENGEIISEDLIKQIEAPSKWVETSWNFGGDGTFEPVKVTVNPFFLRENGDIHPCEGISWSDEITGDVILPLTGDSIKLTFRSPNEIELVNENVDVNERVAVYACNPECTSPAVCIGNNICMKSVNYIPESLKDSNIKLTMFSESDQISFLNSEGISINENFIMFEIDKRLKTSNVETLRNTKESEIISFPTISGFYSGKYVIFLYASGCSPKCEEGFKCVEGNCVSDKIKLCTGVQQSWTDCNQVTGYSYTGIAGNTIYCITSVYYNDLGFAGSSSTNC